MDPRLPPWHPSMQCSLPPLPNLFYPKTAEERLHNPDKKRLLLHAFKAHCEGPSDSSCWVVPGRIAMGGYPLGRARAKVMQKMLSLVSVLVLFVDASGMHRHESPVPTITSPLVVWYDCLLTSPSYTPLHSSYA